MTDYPNDRLILQGAGEAIFAGGVTLLNDVWHIAFMRNATKDPGSGLSNPQVFVTSTPDLLAGPYSTPALAMNGFDPGILALKGELIVSAHGGKNTPQGIFYSMRSGSVWNAPATLAKEVGQTIESTLTKAAGSGWAVYCVGDTDFNRQVYVRDVHAGPMTFGPGRAVGTTGFGPGGRQVRATLAKTGKPGHLGVFYHMPTGGGNRQIYMVESADKGATWLPGKLIAASAEDLVNPFGIAVSDGSLRAYYVTRTVNGGALGAVNSLDQGATWGSPYIAADRPVSRPVMVQDADGRLICVTAFSDPMRLVAFEV